MQFVRELYASYRRVSVDLPHVGRQLDSPEAAYAVLAALIGDSACERFVVLHLDSKNRLRSYTTAGVGDVDSCAVPVSTVFQTALLANAAAIIVGHNHPSGSSEPSPQDLALTKRLVDAGEILGISVLDHVVVGDGDYVSLAQQGLVKGTAA